MFEKMPSARKKRACNTRAKKKNNGKAKNNDKQTSKGEKQKAVSEHETTFEFHYNET